ncbi:lipopolysaccharide biosynthesis protein [uncultured Bacteroides sp.]|uniref:lipopolysaccharide biosynthesis protein n=1 Tax=uncultured Bacteroides sp. TaxID=162156 RepID=UPI002596B4B5|nr:lipopolysaccharide biosynthesis protein [uncultured Bacteroides sp.]
MSESLKQKTVKGLAWNTVNMLSNRVLTFAIGIVLARLLTPADYGMVAMIGVFTSVLGLFTDGGLTTALVRKENRTEEDMATVFYYNLVACYAIYAILFCAAPFIADFYDMPILKEITRITTLGLLIGPFGGIQNMLLTTRIDFKTPAIIGVMANVVAGVTAIALAYNGYGVWALVVQGLVAAVIGVAARVYIVRWFPKTRFSVKAFKELFGFSSKMLASSCLDTLYNNITPLIVGKFYSSAQLGAYERARGWAALPSSTFTGVLQGVTFPVLSKLQTDNERLCHNYRKLLKMSAFVCFPLMVGLATVARPLTLFVLTDKWIDSIMLLQIICFSMMWYPIHSINLNLLIVKGRSDLFFRLEIVKKIYGLILLSCTLPFGLIVYCCGSVISSLFSLAVNTYYTGKIINVGFAKQMYDLFPILINSFVMGGICLLVQLPFEDNGVKLIVAILTGFLYYLMSSYIVCSESLKELLKICYLKM